MRSVITVPFLKDTSTASTLLAITPVSHQRHGAWRTTAWTRELTGQVGQLQVVGQCHSFGVRDAQAVGQGGGVVCGAAHMLCNLQEEREKAPSTTL